MEYNEQWKNKFTSLKAAFRSTDSSKHFHGNPPNSNISTNDYPEVSEPQLVSKSRDVNTPTKPKFQSFKHKLMTHYRQNLRK